MHSIEKQSYDNVKFPESVDEIKSIIRSYSKISIRGAGYTQGGQTFLNKNSVTIDMSRFDWILLNDDLTVSVGAGVRWKDLLRYLDFYRLSVYTADSYADFSVGGSVSTDSNGSLCDSIVSMKILTSRCETKVISKSSVPKLFKAAISGYGGVGVILEIVLMTYPNFPMKRTSLISSIEDIPIEKIFNGQEGLEMYEGIIHGNEIINVFWHRHLSTKSTVDLTDEEPNLESSRTFTNMKFARVLSKVFEKKALKPDRFSYRNAVLMKHLVTRSHLLSKNFSMTIQNYSIPIRYHPKIFLSSIERLARIYHIDIDRKIIRFVHGTTIPLLNSSPVDNFTISLEIIYGNTFARIQKLQIFTNFAIDLAISLSGTYSLTGGNFASIENFRKVYPGWKKYLDVKEHFDPEDKFDSRFLSSYLNYCVEHEMDS